MNYIQQQRSPTRQIVGFGAVVLFHILLIWALVAGLGQNIVDVIKQPLETKIIKDTKPPPPEAPPPPPPQLAAPPPPYIPPPDIQIQQPPPPQNHAITAVTHAPPPTTTLAPTPPPRTAPAVPDRDVGAVALQGPTRTYPQEMLDEEREGKVWVTCNVGTDGRTSDCAVTKVIGGEAFARNALSAVTVSRYSPAVHNGVPVAVRHTFVFTYKLSN
jgi:protein TonB